MRSPNVHPGQFHDDFKEVVRSRTDLVSLVKESVALIPVAGGREFKGLCPFHDDHNPSMCVYPDRQTYRCWSCNEGGDCFSWTQKIEGVDFRAALESLALRAGLELPKTRRSPSDHSADQRKRGYDALAWAARQLHQCLRENPAAERARRYLADRGFRNETIDQFQLGYHPDAWQWLMDRAGRQFSQADLAAAGLIETRKSGSGYRDHFLFFDRVVFPIHDERGRTVAFGGRLIPGGPPSDAGKYINSSDNPFFAKNRVLYGFDVARDAVRRSETAIVMEGYTDCILSHQHGVKNAVATLGTALTENHVRLLKRFARQVVLVFDGDGAGLQAAERSVEKFLAQDLDLRILTLPAGMDPADYFKSHTYDEFMQLAAQSPEAWEFQFKMLAGRYGLESIDSRERVLDEMLQLICQSPRLAGTAREDLILGRLASRLGLPESRIRTLLQNVRQTRRTAANHAARQHPTGTPAQNPQSRNTNQPGNNTHRIDRDVRKGEADSSAARPSRDDMIETDLLEVLFAAPDRFEEIRQEIGPDDFLNLRYRNLFETCLMLADSGVEPAFETLLTTLEDPEDKRLAVWLETQTRQKHVLQKLAGTAGNDVEHCLLRQALDNLKWRRLEHRHARVKQQLATQPETSPDSDQARELLRQSMEYHRKRATKKTSIKNL